MTTPPKKKTPRASASRRAPLALVAYHLVPGSKDKEPVYIPIGSAIAHPDGEGYTLRLDLVPTMSSQIILRKPKPRNEASANVPVETTSAG